MSPPSDTTLKRLAAQDHGVLSTLHSTRGVDAVPVVFVVDADGYVGVPIDRVKPKTTQRLQRERNLQTDPRATLLVDHWNRDDWSELWWIRAQLLWQNSEPERAAALADQLAHKYVHYRDRPFSDVLVFRITATTSWAASPPTEP